MRNKLSLMIAVMSLAPVATFADVKIYGKANISLEYVDEGEESHTELMSNASRLGFSGSETINASLEAIYQAEYEIYVDDADTFTQRNIFVGVKGEYGQLIAGHIDTPLKTSQNKVDVFNDLRGDIKNWITPNDNRASNSVAYSSPTFGGFGAQFSYISSEDEDRDDGKSASVSFSQDGLYLSIAFDQDVEEENADALRGVVQYTINALQFGFLYEQFELENSDSKDAWMLSALYNLNNDWAIKAQYAVSEIGFEYDELEIEDEEGEVLVVPLFTDETESLSLGVDRKVTKNFMVYGFYTAITGESDLAAEDVVDNDYVGVGVELKF